MSENIFPRYGFSRGFYYMNDNSKNAYTVKLLIFLLMFALFYFV